MVYLKPLLPVYSLTNSALMENNAKKGLVKSRPRTQGIIQMALALTSFFVRVKSEKLAEKEIFLLPNDQYTLYKQKVLSEIDTTIPLKSTLKMSTNSSLAYITSYSEAYFGKINSSQLCHQAIALSKESLLLVCNQSVEIYELNQKSTKLVKTKTLPFSFNTSTILLSKLPRISDSIQNLSGVIAGRYEDSDQNDFIVFQNVINGKAQEDRAEFDTRQFGNRQFTGKIRLTQLNNRLVMLHDYNFNLTSSTSDNVLVYDQVDGNIQMLSLDNSNLGHNLKNLISVWASPQNESVYIYIVFTTETDLNPPMHKKRKLEAESTPMLHLSRCIMSDKVELTSCKKIVTHKPVYGGRISLFDSSKEKRSSMKYISFTKHEVEVCDLNQIDLSFSNCLIIQNSLPQMSSIVPDSVDLLSSDQEQLAAEIDRFRQADDQVLILVYSDNQTGKEVISLQIEINNEVNPPQYKIKERLNDQSAELLAYSKTNGFIIRNDSYSVYEEDEKHERMVLRASEMPNSDASLTIMIGGQPKINLKVHKLIQQNLTQVKGPTKWPTFFSFKDELTTLKIPRNALVANNLRYKFIDKSNTVVEEYFYDLTGIDIEMLIIGYKIRKFWPTFEGEQIHGIVILEEIIIPQDPPSGPQNHIAAYFVCEAFKEELYLCSLDNSNAKQAIRKFIMEKDEEIFEVYYNQFSETPGLVVISGIHDPTIINQFTRLSYFRTDKMEFDFSYQKRFANLRPRLSRFVMMGEDFTFWMFSEEEKKFDIYVSKSLHLSEMEQTPTIPFEDLKLYDLDADLFCPTGISFDPSKTDTLDISSSCGKHNSILRLNISDSTNIRPINVVQTSRLASSGQRGNQTVCTFPKEYLVFDYDSSSLYFTTTWTDESISEVDLKSMFNFKTIDQLFCIRGTNYAVIKGKDHFKEDLFAVIEGDSQDDQRKRYVRITKGRGEILHVKGNHEFLFIVTSQTKSYKHALKFFLEGPVYLFRTKPGTQEVNFEVKISSENGEGPSETSETLTSSLKTVFVNHSVELDSKGFQTVKAKQGEYDIIDLLNLTVPIYSIDLAKKIETFENQSRIQVRNAVTLLKPVRISYDFPERIDGIDTFGVGKAYKIIGHKLSSDNRDTTKIYIFDSINKMQGVYDTKNLCDDYSVESALSNERKEGFALAVLTCKDLISYGLHYSIIDYAQRSITNGVLKLDLNLRQLKIKSLGDGRQFILVGFDEVVRRLTLIRLVIEFGQVSIKDMITKPTLISSKSLSNLYLFFR